MPSFSISGPDSLLEGNAGTTPANFTITLEPFTDGPVSFDLASVSVTASAPADYVAFAFSSVNLTTAPGVSISLARTVGDLLAEGDETFKIVISNVRASGITYGGTIEKLFTIIDDDFVTPPTPGTVPEPGSAALAGGALLALAWAGQRARRRLVR